VHQLVLNGQEHNRVTARRLLAVLVVVFALHAGLTSPARADAWKETRAELIDPLNAMLHSHWPRELADRNLDVLLRLYLNETGTGISWQDPQLVSRPESERTLRWRQTSDSESIRERYENLLALFSRIDRVEQRVERVDWRNPTPEGYRATVHVVVRGRGPEGDHRQLEQWATLYVRYFDPFWEITSEEITARTLVSSRQPRFEVANDATGVHDLHRNEVSPTFRLFGDSEENPVRQASGVAIGDYDGDGCEDMLMTGSPTLSLYRSLCDGRFEDATAESGLPMPYPAAASGATFFDYDNDGSADLFIAAVTGGDKLFRNDGSGHFSDATEAARIQPNRWGSMPVVADYDRDGFLDVYVARMGDHYRDSPTPPNNARNGVRGTLLHNEGDGTFRDVSKKAGVDSPGWDMASAWGDYDGDGWPDLYVANEFGWNRMFRNNGDGTFEDVTLATDTADGGAGMGVTWGDYDGDGDLDLYVAGMHSNSGWTLFHPDFPMPIPWYFKILGLFTDAVQVEADDITDKLTRGSTLFRNEGDGTFTDVSIESGVRDAQWGWATKFFDYDNDGRLDLYVVNGFITGPVLDDL
jgi:FG-GAP-like repeat